MSMREHKQNHLSTTKTNSWGAGNKHHFLIPLLFLCMLTLAASAYAAHDTTVTISPDQARCGELPLEYTANVKNIGTTDNIREVRIYDDVNPVDGQRDAGIVDFACGDPPEGWELEDRLASFNYCQYETSIVGGYMIDPNENLTFTFEVQLDDASLTDCGNEFKVATIDDVEPFGQVVFKKPKILVDCSDPVVYKDVGTPKILMSPPDCDMGPFQGEPNAACDWWITQDTLFDITAEDNADTQNECDLGVNYCQYTYTVDGGADPDFATECANFDGDYDNGWCVFENEDVLNFDFSFNEDSVHDITIECYDVVGNMTSVTELDKVDSQAPDTEKVISDPKKIAEVESQTVEWIDGVTEITLTAEDNGPICAIGVDKIWYMNTIDIIEQSCWVEEVCQPVVPSPYDVCDKIKIDAAQAECSVSIGTYGSWEECVEAIVKRQCPNVDSRWHLYDGTPIQKDEESCHVLQFFSVDNIGNKEDMQVNCFFVDLSPPIVDKNNGNAILDRGEPAFMTPENQEGAFHWITQDMPVTFACTDPEPHPSGDEELCFKVSYDYPEWNYITDQYCDGVENLTDDGYCCIDASEESYDFYFQEESMHNLEYYCEDAVEKKSDVHTQYYKVDDTKPVIDKLVGQPQVGTCPPPQGFDQTGGDCYIRDHVTPITFEAYDGEGLGCAIDDITCEWKYRVNGGDWGQTYTFGYKEGPWNTYGDTPAVITKEYLSDSIKWTIHIEGEAAHYGAGLVLANLNDPDHPFQVWANNGNQKWQTQVLHLDEAPCWNYAPEDCPSGICPNGITATPAEYNSTNQDFTITVPKSLLGEAGSSFRWAMHVERSDQGYYPEAWANDWCGPISKYEEEMISPGIIFQEDSRHDLEIKCWDALGNTAYDQETFQVDSIPPETTKTYGDPHYPAVIVEGENHWIKTTTPITLDATDNKVGVDKTFYRYCLYSYTPNGVANGSCTCEGSTDFAEYSNIPFNIAEESQHCIEFYSTDLLGNTEAWNSQLVYVEDTPPVVTKTVGDEKVACEDDNPLGCDYYITKDTPITFECIDPIPHPVNNVVNKYRYSLGDDCISFGEPTGWLTADGEIRFPTDSCHKLEYYCEDALGNTSGILSEIDVVDTVGPEITVDVSEPKITQECPPGMEGECLYIDGVTVITVNAVDPQPHPVDAVTCDWDYEVSGGEKLGSGGIGITPPFDIIFPEESVHSLNIVCKDALGNDTEFNGTYIVDHTPPETTKWYEGPQYSDGLPEYPFFQTTTGNQAVDIKVEDLGDSIKWTVDFPLTAPYEETEGNGLMAVGLVIATDGEGNGPVFQIHNNDGQTVVPGPHGTWLYGSWGPAIDTSGTWFGWPNHDLDVPVTELDWVEATGGRYNEVNPEGIFTITIDKSELGEDFHWALYTAIGGGFNNNYLTYQQATYPNEFGWGEPIVTSTNYEYAEGVGVYPKWITSDTEIYLSATDNIGPHDSGVKATYWRNSLVDDSYCWDQELCQQVEGSGEFNLYEGPFHKGEQSCHLIEYYSVDNVDKTEVTKKQCVFVDNTPPTPVKTVGEPKTEWHPTETELDYLPDEYEFLVDSCWSTDLEKRIDCWKVTQNTPITLECSDPDPHPVDHEVVCFNVERDATDETSEYCGIYQGTMNDKGYCCLSSTINEFYFQEDCVHDLKYYCIDALGNETPVEKIDDEKFKVEGKIFEIQLNKKWNLISVPFALINPSTEEVLKDVKDEVKTMWTYDPLGSCDNLLTTDIVEEWCVYHLGDPTTSNLDTMEQGWGYWLYAKDPAMLVVGGSEIKPGPVVPASRNLKAGWNLIGYYGNEGGAIEKYDGPDGEGKRVIDALISLGADLFDKGAVRVKTFWELNDPQWKDLAKWDRMDPGAGYWILTPADYIYG